MNVTVIFRGGFPNGGPMAKRLLLYCKGLIEQGVRVNIVIPNPPYSHKSSNRNNEVSGFYDDIPYKYLCKTTIRSNNFFIRRIVDFTGYLKLIAYLFKNKEKDQLLFIVDIRSLFLIILYIIGKINNTKIVYELNEHPIIITSKVYFWFSKKIIYPLLDGYIVISNNLANLVETFHIDRHRILTVPILINKESSIKSDSGKVHFKRPFILHTGTIVERKDGIVGVIESLDILNKRGVDIDFFLTGSLSNSEEHEKIRELITGKNLDKKVKFLGFLSEDQLSHYQKNCSMAIINKTDNIQNTYCFPTKLGEYLSFARPVIMTKVGNYYEFFEDRYNAYLIPPNDVETLAARIIEILTMPTESKLVGSKGKELAYDKFLYKEHSMKITSFFRDIINNA